MRALDSYRSPWFLPELNRPLTSPRSRHRQFPFWDRFQNGNCNLSHAVASSYVGRERNAVPIPETMARRRTPIPPAQVVLLQSLLSSFLTPIVWSPACSYQQRRPPTSHGRRQAQQPRTRGRKQEGVSMNLGLELGVQRLSVATEQSPSVVHQADHLPNAGFPHPQTQVAAINVDTAGREVPLSGQKGICVQWR
jgi:hypothetical protein